MVWVIKHSGEKERFDTKKVRYALIRSGASDELAKKIADQVKEEIYDGIPTSSVYKLAYEHLNTHDITSAHRFGLKLALMRLGPTGYPFEKYIARILSEHGFSTQTNLILAGCNVDHEIDVVAQKGDQTYMVECKYHNQFGFASGLKEAMYTYARFLDLVEAGNDFTHPWLITNTKVTLDAIAYGEGKGMKLTAWGYPERQNLQRLVEGEAMYPVTILKRVADDIKDRLINNGFITIKDLMETSPTILAKACNISPKKARKLQAELTEIQLHV